MEKINPTAARAIREATGLGVSEFAERLGVERKTVWRWEKDDGPGAERQNAVILWYVQRHGLPPVGEVAP